MYKDICGNSKFLEQVKNGMNILTKKGIRYHVFSCISSQNKGDIHSMMDISESMGASSFRISIVREVGRARNSFSELHISLPEWIMFLNSLAQYYRSNNYGLTLMTAGCALEAEYIHKHIYIPCIQHHCRGGSEDAYVNPIGEIFPCPIVGAGEAGKIAKKTYRGGNILEANIEELWSSTGFNKFREYINQSVSIQGAEDCPFYIDEKCIPCPFAKPTCKDKLSFFKALS